MYVPRINAFIKAYIRACTIPYSEVVCIMGVFLVLLINFACSKAMHGLASLLLSLWLK